METNTTNKIYASYQCCNYETKPSKWINSIDSDNFIDSMQNDIIARKTSKTGYLFKKYKLPDGKIINIYSRL
jgi:hypothetical protein